MKKVFLVLVLLLMCGCSKEPKIYDEILSSGYGVGWGGNPDGIVCEEIKDATYLTANYFLTKDGKIFRFHETQLFSNDKNCIEYPYEGKKIKFAYMDNLYDESNIKVLAYDYDTSTFITEEVYKNKNNGSSWYDPLANVEVSYDFISTNDMGGEILYVKDHNVYKYNSHYDNELNKEVADEPYSLGSIPKNEKIMYMADALIKTDKNIYQLTNINEEECNKYIDVKCKYGFVRSDLSDIYDKIIFVSQDMVVDDGYHMYGQGHGYTIAE